MNSPSNLVAGNITEAYADLNWQLNSSDQILVRIWRTNDETWKTFSQIHWSSNPNLSSFRDSTVKPGEIVYYKVNVADFNSQSAFSNGISVNIPGIYLAPPANVSGVALSDTSIKLTWTDNSIEDGFEVLRLDNGNWNSIAILPANSIEFIDTNLAPDTIYRYRVGSFLTSGIKTLD